MFIPCVHTTRHTALKTIVIPAELTPEERSIVQRKSDRRSSPCQGHRKWLRAYLEGLRVSAVAHLNHCDAATRRAALMACVSMTTLFVMLGPLKVTLHELATRTAFVVWQVSTVRAINQGRGGKP